MEIKKMKKEQLIQECLRKETFINELHEALRNKDNHVHRLNDMINESKNTTAQFRAKCTELSKEVVGLENKTAKMSKDITALVKEKDALTRKNKEYLNLIDKYKCDANTHIETIKVLNNRNDELSLAIDELKDKLSTYKDMNAKISKLTAENSNLITELTKYKTLNSKLQALVDDNNNLVEQLNDCVIKRNQFERQIEQLTEYKTIAERTMENQQDDYKHLTDLYNNVFDENVKNRGKVRNLKDKIGIISVAYIVTVIIAIWTILAII